VVLLRRWSSHRTNLEISPGAATMFNMLNEVEMCKVKCLTARCADKLFADRGMIREANANDNVSSGVATLDNLLLALCRPAG
jgi:hypothetical protein